MPAPQAPASVVLTIDRYDRPTGTRSNGPFSQLANLIAELELSATWSTGTLAASTEIETLLRLRPEQELALAADRAWLNAEIRRAEFSRQLSVRVARGRAGGSPATTLVLPEPTVLCHLDAISRSGIQALVAVTSETGVARPWWSWFRRNSASNVQQGPRLLRHGIWHIPVTLGIPLTNHFSVRGSARQAIRELARQIDAGSWLHLSVDVEQIAHQGGKGMNGVERLLSYLKQRQIAGDIQVGSVRAAVRQLVAKYRGTPAVSLLAHRAA